MNKFRRKRESTYETDWLGAEALPGGIVTIEGDARAALDAKGLAQPASKGSALPSGLIAITGRWMRNAMRLN